MVEKAWLLPNGTLDMERSVLIGGDKVDDRVTVPVYSVLVKLPDRHILIDTGLNPNGITDPENTWGPRAKLLLPTITEETDIRTQLRNHGVEPEDIGTVIITHLHWDHTGGLQYLQHARIVTQKIEHEFAYNPEPRLAGSYMKNHYDFPLHYEFVEGDVEYCPGIDLIFTPGHTPGHMSVMLTFDSGKRIIIPGDAVYSYQNIKDGLAPGNCWDKQAGIDSLNKLKKIAAETGAVIYPSHDPDLDMIDRANREING